MPGIHSTRLATSKAHRRFVADTRKAVQKMGWEIPDPISVSPSIIGAQPLQFPVPPGFERAFGYWGDLRFVEFGYSVRSRQFGYSDGADDIPSDERLWLWFLRHPVISTHVPQRRYPTLYGTFSGAPERTAIEQITRSGGTFEAPHCLLLDRRDRKAYISRRDQTMILFALMEPEGADHHTVFVDGVLMSAGTENYKVPPPIELGHQLRSFLDAKLELAKRADRADLTQ
jgi:hypothetical protein